MTLTNSSAALAGPDANLVNEDGKPPAVKPQTSPITVSPAFDCEAPANSLTIIRIPPANR